MWKEIIVFLAVVSLVACCGPDDKGSCIRTGSCSNPCNVCTNYPCPAPDAECCYAGGALPLTCTRNPNLSCCGGGGTKQGQCVSDCSADYTCSAGNSDCDGDDVCCYPGSAGRPGPECN